MWLATKFGFYSIVQKQAQDNGPEADYRYRVFIGLRTSTTPQAVLQSTNILQSDPSFTKDNALRSDRADSHNPPNGMKPTGMTTFDGFFKAATGNDRVPGGSTPYDYQRRLACGEASPDTDEAGTPCRSQLISIPTGLGKTAAVVLAWAWNRLRRNSLQQTGPDWPRRLVYCLPMRTLVEQTEANVREWLENLEKAKLILPGSSKRVHVLMGGEEKRENEPEWDLYPEKDAILIGTQDMLLSRALNRGYGMSRYRWPMHFGLLNNDCLWVMDETQLMGSGLPTTTQLEAFRTTMQPTVTCHSWWMSATSERGWLKTVDFDPDKLAETVELSDKERATEKVKTLLDASKPLEHAGANGNDLKALAKEIVLASEASEGLTLVVVNTVKTARKLFAEVEKLTRKGPTKLLLMHSRFRPEDRATILEQVLTAEGQRQIVISTQVIEAGIDLSAATLYTELAPWSSLVQRFGRCNRRGILPNTRVVWFESAAALPYTEEQLSEARRRLNDPILTGVSPNQLRDVPIPASDRPVASHVIRRKDLMELFDTTPDLAGNDIDIDRWVREIEESSVQVAWRKWEGGKNGRPRGADQTQPSRAELCPVSIKEFRDFVKKTDAPIWRWDFLEGEWTQVKADAAYPGQTYLLPAEAGGYLRAMGWNPDSKETVEVIIAADEKASEEKTDADTLSQSGLWQSIALHTDWVCKELDSIAVVSPAVDAALLGHAARWHDWGKAHAAFQAKLKPEKNVECERNLGAQPVAKAPKDAWRSSSLAKKPSQGELRRKFFRHELASALGVLQPETNIPVEGADRDLVAYLIAAHHGKVRLSIRSLPGEWPAPDAGRFARGIWDGDPLPQAFLGGSSGSEVTAPAVILSLEPMELGLGEQSPFNGLPSWSERMLSLRDSFGPFRLAFLEVLLRAADERASALASTASSRDTEVHEPSRTNPTVAGITARGATSPESGARAGERVLEHVDGGRTGKPRVAEGNTRPAGATRTIETIHGELAYSEIAERIASRAAEIQPEIALGSYASSPLDESLLARLHGELCAGLVPDWAGKWRTVEVTVGVHEPPPSYQVAVALRDYAVDLAARWESLLGDDEEMLLETLAFAEGRFFSIHPFRDFNGRVARPWLREILRRAGLPEVRLEVRSEEEKAAYFAALRAADRHDLAPLKIIWRQRFAEAI